jgi:hypothetical protein
MIVPKDAATEWCSATVLLVLEHDVLAVFALIARSVYVEFPQWVGSRHSRFARCVMPMLAKRTFTHPRRGGGCRSCRFAGRQPQVLSPSGTFSVHRVKVAVAQAVAVWHIRNPAEQVSLSPLVKKLGCGNVGRKPDFEAGELDRPLSVNAHVQTHHALKVSGNVV